jgi:hypothetical protein
MKPVILILLAFFTSFCFGCMDNEHEEEAGSKNASTDPVETVFQEVMKGHDAGMAKVGRLRKSSAQLGKQIDSLNKIGSKNSIRVASIKRVKDSLDAADAAMFIWMEGFKADTLTDVPDQRMRYLEKQKASVHIVHERIMNSLRLYDSLHK